MEKHQNDFEIVPGEDKTILHFTHYGIVPEKECYMLCHEGWNTVIRDYQLHFITDGKHTFYYNNKS